MTLALAILCAVLGLATVLLAVRAHTLRTRLHMTEQLHAANEERLRTLATEMVEQASQALRTRHEQTLSGILAPLRDNLDAFQRQVRECYDRESREVFSLKDAVHNLVEANVRTARETSQLSQALRGNTRIQGQLGEMVLESILERSGLRKDVDYMVQVATDDASRKRPDVVVRYPGKRYVVIDAKVSLTDYLQYSDAEDAARQAEYGQRHVRSVRNHVRELDAKGYQDRMQGQSLDFVMMFIPNEGAYMAAMRMAPELWTEAWNRRVLIISPTHLLTALSIVSELWRQERQEQNALRIAEEGGNMYDKFVGFVADMEKIKSHLGNATDMWDKAMNKLQTGSGNLVRRAENMRRLGAKAAKALDAKYLDDTDTPSGEER